jgi:hypothetical protein
LFFVVDVVAIMRLKLCERWKRTAEDSSHTGKIRTATATTVVGNFVVLSGRRL